MGRRRAELICDTMDVLDSITQDKLGFVLSNHADIDTLIREIRDEYHLYAEIKNQLDDQRVFLSHIVTHQEALQYLATNDPSLQQSIRILHRTNMPLLEVSSILLADTHLEHKRLSIWQSQSERMIRMLKFLCNEIYLAEVKDMIEESLGEGAADLLPSLDCNVDEVYELYTDSEIDTIKKIISEH